ncbi:hypothetical protein D8S78_22380 [Natrialba swarupiae]|nr:hypothetical protein [Natrialba swarupiae]
MFGVAAIGRQGTELAATVLYRLAEIDGVSEPAFFSIATATRLSSLGFRRAINLITSSETRS